MIASIKKTAFTLLAVLGLSTLAFAKTVTVDTAVGKVQAPFNPQKVVVLDVGVLDNLNQLGVIDKVGMTPPFKYAKILSIDTTNKKEAGTLFEPDFEAIAKYHPDLILVSTRSAKQREPLSKIAPTLDLSIDNNEYMPSVKKQLKTIGAIFDKEDKANQLIKQLDEKIQAGKSITKGKGNALFVLVNGNKLSTSGDRSRFGWLYRYLDIPAAAKDIATGPHGQPVSFEFIKQHDPDWLLVFDRFAAIGKEGKSAAQMLDNEVMHDTKSWKNKHIVYLDSAIYLQVGGLTGIHKNIDLIIDAFKK